MKVTHLIRTILIFALSSVALADAKPYQKPGPRIGLADPYQVIELEPGQQKQVKVAFNAPVHGQLFITAKPKPGVTLATPHPEWHFDLTTEKPEITLNVEGQNNGKYHIMFHAQVMDKKDTERRVFGIAVQVGDMSALEAKLQKPETKKEFVIMKAEEKVSR